MDRPGLLERVRAKWAHAFSLDPEKAELDSEDEALLDKIANAIAKRGLQIPAMLWLESLKPLHFVGAQALMAFRPIASMVVDGEALKRLGEILERRDGIEQLLRRVEATA